MYRFIKKFLPVLFICIGIYVLIFAIYTSSFFITSYMIKQQSLDIKEHSVGDMNYTKNVKLWVYKNVKYVSKPGSEISPPEITYMVREGDCTEYSLLMTRMLNDGGIDAHPIYGSSGTGSMHESVEYTIDGITRRIDSTELPTFKKHGDGLQSTEYVYDVFWFLK